MRAIVYKGVYNVGAETIKDPELGNGEALLRVKAAAICGTDLRIYQHGHHLIPEGTNRILGHEISGVIESVSRDAAGLEPGMSVAVAPNIHCGTCVHCIKGDTHLCEDYSAFGISIDGGFAEYMVLSAKAVRQGNIVPMRAETDFAQAALNEPLSCCYNSLEYTQFSLGEVILIIGAGPIGIMHTLLANRMGAAKVIVSEISDDRLTEMKKFGVDVTVNPERESLKAAVMSETDGRGVDVAIVACPIAAVYNEALECLAPLGRMNFFGGLPKNAPMTTINANIVHYNNIKVVGTSRQSMRQYLKTLSLIEAGKIDLGPLVTGSYTLDDAAEAFDAAQRAEGLKHVFAAS